MDKIPKIVDADGSRPYLLKIVFENGIKKEYDCLPLISKRPEFNLIKDKAFFKSVHVDSGGYGISWNDDIDISEYELWNNGRTIP